MSRPKVPLATQVHGSLMRDFPTLTVQASSQHAGLRVGGWRRVPMQTKEQGSSVWGPEPSLGALPGCSSPCPTPQSSLPPLIPLPWLCTPLSKQPARYASAGNAAQQGALLQAKNCSPPGPPRTASQPPGSVSTGRVQTRVCGVGPGHCTVSKDPE